MIDEFIEEKKQTTRKVARENSKESIFEMLNVPNNVEEEEKTMLALAITKELASRGSTQRERAEILGVAQPIISNIERFELGGISIQRLLRYARHLGIDVAIVVSTR